VRHFAERFRAVFSKPQYQYFVTVLLGLMEALICAFEPVVDTHTHIELPSWYCAKCLWHAARERDFLITTGMKSNRWLRVPDDTTAQGWRWQKVSEYAAGLSEQDFQLVCQPRGGKKVYVHVVKTSVRKLYRGPLVIVRHSLTAPLAQTRYWASSALCGGRGRAARAHRHALGHRGLH
jgi:hypothetical protein